LQPNGGRGPRPAIVYPDLRRRAKQAIRHRAFSRAVLKALPRPGEDTITCWCSVERVIYIGPQTGFKRSLSPPIPRRLMHLRQALAFSVSATVCPALSLPHAFESRQDWVTLKHDGRRTTFPDHPASGVTNTTTCPGLVQGRPRDDELKIGLPTLCRSLTTPQGARHVLNWCRPRHDTFYGTIIGTLPFV